jgi:hypothetical protein
MIFFVDTQSKECGRTFYECLYAYDWRLANITSAPIDENYIDYNLANLYYMVPHGYNEQIDNIPQHVLEYTRSGKYKILFDFSFEGEYRPIRDFIKYMTSQSIPVSSYKILSGADYFGDPPPNVCHCPMFDLKTKHNINSIPKYDFGITERKKFIMLNARPRPHRVLLTYFLYEKGLLDQGHCSLQEEENAIENYNFIDTLKIQQHNGYQIDFDKAKEMQQHLPFTVDDVDVCDSLIINDSPISDIYKYVDFAVITETVPWSGDNQVFVTEKTFKAIANKKPFIVYGDMHLLLYLRSLGYKTFDFLIDESYDSMPEIERLHKVISEIERLCKVDFATYEWEIIKVVEHNYNVLMDTSTYTHRVQHMIDFLS